MDANDLSLPDLRAVIAVAAHRHFGRAAEALRLAQPTLSAQVKKVERALGGVLFERSARRFLVTEGGERLLPLMREVVAAAERLAHSAADGADAEPARTLRLGVIPTLGPYLMPHLLLPYRRERKGSTLAIVEQTTVELLAALLDGTLDAAILSLPLRHDSIATIPLFNEPFRLIAPRGAPVLDLSPLLSAKLRADDMVLLAEGHCLREQSIAACGKRGGSTPRVVTASLETLKYLVASGGGYSLLPLLASDLPKGLAELVQVRRFDDREPARKIALCFRRSFPRRDALADFADFVRSHVPPGCTRLGG